MDDLKELVRLDLEHVIHPMQDHRHNQEGPLVIVEGKGAIIKDAQGKEYIDGLAGLWNVAVGHGRAELAEAAAVQMRTLGYASGYAGSSNIPGIKLAAKLAEIAPGDLKATYFTTGGAESNESAFKIARFYWRMKGRPDKVKIISRQEAYHGLTAAAMQATGMRNFWMQFEPAQPGFSHIPTHYCFHCSLKKTYPECGVACADTLEQQILAESPETVAAFIAEPVHGAAGVIPPPPEYFPKIREICTKYDVLFIGDEVITGFGRLGSWFGLQQWDVAPDLMTFAKAVTSAYIPLGGVMVSERIHQVFRDLPEGTMFNHGYTYSLHPVCCAVALANLDIFEREGLVEKARTTGKYFQARLRELDSLPGVGEVRGLGLIAGIELAADKKGTPLPASMGAGMKVYKEAMARGLSFRAKGDTLNLCPPLVITEAQVDSMVNILGESIKSVIA